tara:strand:- start:175 stop:684 length:510 start_codon:yes stop_codon:yes gene_type:complete
MATALFVTRNDVVKFTAMNGNVDTDKFIQYIKIAQDIHIQNYLGSKLYELIEGYVAAGTLGNHADELALVTDHLKPMLCHWAMVEYLPFAAYTIANKGVFKHSSENAQNVEKNEIDFLIEKERTIAQYYTDRFIDYMSFNAATKFPTYYTNNNDDVFPDRESNFSGWVL